MAEEAASSSAGASDERISFRGPMQRLLISPEIGALIGTIMVWTLFWATSEKFSTAATSASWLDGAAPLGIMAVAIALLMIGGEFDLSAGVMTGSTGILLGIFAQKFLGDGASLWIAIPIAFLAAGLIGWLNGTFVNKTGLPSFIVTLATFFVLQGVNLVFSKKMVDKVLVENIDEVQSFKTFERIFAKELTLEKYGLRDPIFFAGVIIGGLLLVAGLLEMSLQRRESANAKALPVLLVGAVAAAGGFAMIHGSDGVGANLLWGTVGLVGAIVATLGYARWRFEPAAAHGKWWVPQARTPVLIGLGLVIVSFVLTRPLDGNQKRVLLSVPSHGVKVAIGLLSLAVGIGAVAWRGIARQRQLVGARTSSMTIPTIVVTSLIGGLVALVSVLSFMQLCTEQGFRSALQVGGFVGGVLALLSAKGVARRHSARAQLLIAAVASLAIVFAAAVIRHDADSTRFRSGLFGALSLMAALVLGNALLDHSMVKRRLAIHGQDVRGRVLAFGGVALAVLGLGQRLLYSNAPIRASILWWLLVTLVAAYVLARTRYGNWIFAVGGNKDAARAVGVPVDKVKVGLFMMVSLVGCLVGMIVALRYTSVTSGQGVGQEFEYIIAAVVGGCLLTGGYGSVIGASFGAMISAMLKTGIPGSRWNTDNKYIFLGVVLFLAVLVNQKVRKKAEEAR